MGGALEGGETAAQALIRQAESSEQEEPREVSGPRLVSCSDDLSVRLWRRQPKAQRKAQTGPRIPSIIRSTSDEEEWFEVGRLPQRHDRAVYAVAWSRVSQKLVTGGSDGRIVVYEELPPAEHDQDSEMTNGTSHEGGESTWVVVAEVEAAHGVFEVNHVCWAKRSDRGKRSDDEEVIVSTGDDGEVKIWIL